MVEREDGGASSSDDRATAAEPKVSALRDGIPSAGFILKAWDVTVQGFGIGRIDAATRGAALAKAWRSDAFNAITFKQFLGIAKARRAMFYSWNFGAAITVCGKSAFYVGRNRACVQIVYPGEAYVLSAHPYDVEPECYRPSAYRHETAEQKDATP